MSIIHISKRENPYVQIDKRALEDNRLSWRAKGILAYLLSKPSGWKVNVKDIWNNGAEGRNAVQDCLHELKEFGYANLITVPGEAGRLMGTQWRVNEEPIGGFVSTEKPKTGTPTNRLSGSRLLSNNKEVSNNESSKVEEEKAEKSENLKESPFEQDRVPPAAAPTRVELHDRDLGGAIVHDIVPAPSYKPFNIDEAATDLKADELCRDKFGRDMNLTMAKATEDFPVFVDEFVSEQKAFCNTYNKVSDFRKHFYYWSLTAPKAKAAAKRPTPGPAQQKLNYQQQPDQPSPKSYMQTYS